MGHKHSIIAASICLAVGLAGNAHADTLSKMYSQIHSALTGLADTQVWGGEPVPANSVPWQVAILDKAKPTPLKARFCGGVVVNQRVVLTASHCMFNKRTGRDWKPNELQVFAGSSDLTSGGKRFDVARIIKNDTYAKHSDVSGDEWHTNDVALLILATPMTGSSYISPIAIADIAVESAVASVGKLLRVSGWGYTESVDMADMSPKKLRAVELNVIAQDECNAKMNNRVGSDALCAGPPQGGKAACSGDSGGPLVSTTPPTVLIGLVSWGGQPCATRGQYGVYARASVFKEWIDRNAVVPCDAAAEKAGVC